MLSKILIANKSVTVLNNYYPRYFSFFPEIKDSKSFSDNNHKILELECMP